MRPIASLSIRRGWLAAALPTSAAAPVVLIIALVPDNLGLPPPDRSYWPGHLAALLLIGALPWVVIQVLAARIVGDGHLRNEDASGARPHFETPESAAAPGAKPEVFESRPSPEQEGRFPTIE
jgi:hypothetical protein